MALLLALLAACSSSTPLMALLFDMPPPGQAQPSELQVRQPRRTPPPSGPVFKVSQAHLDSLAALAKAGPPPNWPELFKQLPKDDEDNIDWMAALESKLITPKGVIDDKDKDPGRTADDDIELSTSGKPNRMVVFSHSTHTQWLTCNNCHNAIFKREAGSAKITMDDIDEGKYCGVCHDKVALAQPSGCKGCHKPIKKS
ncbi:cytochrome c3 family protein [Rhodoferax sp.]|uniref:cytochrome c3 family protein n=1 Tax=Rhodoferax sp. TaxID=50421 RepID=UPI0019E66A91|nr:cytochrome c3 family protein [Rhodoferax sp.]MBE0474671.1 cytochrome c3 family protein [Rhodoferax sp.]